MNIRQSLLMLYTFSGLLFIGATSASSVASDTSPGAIVGATSTADSTAEAEISQFVDLFVKKWNQHDPQELNALWAENGDMINPVGEWEKGKTNVLKILVREHRGVLREAQMKQTITNTLLLSPSMAWVDAKVSLKLPGVPENLERHLDHHIVYLLEKQNSHWRILAIRPYQFLEIHLGLFESPHAFKQTIQRNDL